MSIIERLLDINKEFYDYLKEGMPVEERESFIDKINHYIDRRQLLIEEIKEHDAKREYDKMVEILRLNKEIDSMLERYLDKIRIDIKKTRNKKVNTKKYANPYESASNLDGTFLDKRR